jgi:hypothetical protein
MQTQIQEIFHFVYMHLAHYNPNKKKKFIKKTSLLELIMSLTRNV